MFFATRRRRWTVNGGSCRTTGEPSRCCSSLRGNLELTEPVGPTVPSVPPPGLCGPPATSTPSHYRHQVCIVFPQTHNTFCYTPEVMFHDVARYFRYRWMLSVSLFWLICLVSSLLDGHKKNLISSNLNLLASTSYSLASLAYRLAATECECSLGLKPDQEKLDVLNVKLVRPQLKIPI